MGQGLIDLAHLYPLVGSKISEDRANSFNDYGGFVVSVNARDKILQRLDRAEIEHNIRILYAIESGSRAWGFASENSDYDVRFIYARSRDWYLSVDLEDKRDVVEYEIVDEIDINGWDVRKALQLFWKSNPGIIEWLHSPIVYKDDGVFANAVKALLPDVYAPEKGIYHYRSMAKTNYRGYLRDDVVPLKKYFYVLRPLLSIWWLERYRVPAPIEFHRLLCLLEESPEIHTVVSELLKKKIESKEKDLIPKVGMLNEFIEQELMRLEQGIPKMTSLERTLEPLNNIFRASLLD